MKTLFDIKTFDLIQMNIEIQFMHEMQLKLNLKIILIFSTKMYFNDTNILTLNS